MREKFEEILHNNGIYGESVENVILSVRDMLAYVADKLETEEPYAATTINTLNNAAYEVFDLLSKLDD